MRTGAKTQSGYENIGVRMRTLTALYFVIAMLAALQCSKESDSLPLLPLLTQGGTALSYSVDFLTPSYYTGSNGDPFRTEVDTFLSFAQAQSFAHPLGATSYSVPSSGVFGAGKGPTGTNEHHPAVDLHPTGGATDVNVYAAHDGLLTRCQTLGIGSGGNQYRHFISIARDVTNGSGTVIGKIVTIYGHLALDLDAGMPASGANVTQGQLISQQLYSGTSGGPHLHFEIRYYRAGDSVNNTCTTGGTATGLIEFYGSSTASRTQASTSPWLYGYWDTAQGYGFAFPSHHGLSL